jgi:N-acetylglucosaminyl-diphospho-decaprenol L-rhamnosyltransferase
MTAVAAPGLAIIVVNYASETLLASNLRAVVRGVPEALVIVVDNFTTTAEQQRVADLCERQGWSLVSNPTNVGFGAGMNRGVAAAMERGATTFLMLNPDATIDARSIHLLLDHAAEQPLALIAPVIETSAGAPWFTGADLHLRFGRSRATRHRPAYPQERFEPWLSGACLLMTRELWLRVGGFDERYFLYWEDIELSVRTVRGGGSLLLVDEARAIHDEGGTHDSAARGSDRGKSTVYYYYNIRNRLLFAAQYLDGADRRRWLLNSPAAAWDILMQGGRRQLLHSPKPLKAAVTGTIAGVRLHLAERRRLRGPILRNQPQ